MKTANRASAVLIRSCLVLLALSVASVPAEAQDQAQQLFACYVPRSGVVYRIKAPGLRQACLSRRHVEFSWAALSASADGKIGVGTSTPTSELDVVGDIHATGALRLGTNTMVFDGASNTISSGAGEDIAILPGSPGRVGIGTTSPGEALTVAGAVESTSGGFRFPDGTLQTTAATGGGSGGISGLEIVVGASISVPPGGAETLTVVDCPAGKTVIAGGYVSTRLRVPTSAPLGSSGTGSGWTLVFQNLESSPRSAQGYAICATPG